MTQGIVLDVNTSELTGVHSEMVLYSCGVSMEEFH